MQLNDSDEHSTGSKVRGAESNTVMKAGSSEKGSCLGTSRQQPGRGKQSNWLWAGSAICTIKYVSRVFPFSLTFLLTCCLFLFSFKIILSKEGDKKHKETKQRENRFKEQTTVKWEFAVNFSIAFKEKQHVLSWICNVWESCDVSGPVVHVAGAAAGFSAFVGTFRIPSAT